MYCIHVLYESRTLESHICDTSAEYTFSKVLNVLYTCTLWVTNSRVAHMWHKRRVYILKSTKCTVYMYYMSHELSSRTCDTKTRGGTLLMYCIHDYRADFWEFLPAVFHQARKVKILKRLYSIECNIISRPYSTQRKILGSDGATFGNQREFVTH